MRVTTPLVTVEIVAHMIDGVASRYGRIFAIGGASCAIWVTVAVATTGAVADICGGSWRARSTASEFGVQRATCS